jgi:hypothetical protein
VLDRRPEKGGAATFIDAVQGKHVLGQIDSDVENGHGHLLSEGCMLKRRTSVLLAHTSRWLGSSHSRPARVGDGPFIR